MATQKKDIKPQTGGGTPNRILRGSIGHLLQDSFGDRPTGCQGNEEMTNTDRHTDRKLGWDGLGSQLEKPQHLKSSVCLLYGVSQRGKVGA